jgi:hypothetical protein
MLVWFVRAPLPDAQPWPGRRALAVVDALAWPAGWAVLILAANTKISLGLAGQVAFALCIVLALRRMYRAIARNHRYRFTTWRWAGVGLAFLVTGMAMKLTMHW